jgi:serine/threonine-protein kinase
MVNGTLRAAPFDARRRQLEGEAATVVNDVMSFGSGAANYTVSGNGTLAYITGAVNQAVRRSVVWVSRNGAEQVVAAPARAYVQARLSPDGTFGAFEVRDQQPTIWVWNFAREVLTRLTVDQNGGQNPVWTPDSRQIVFNVPRNGQVFVQSADGTGTPRLLSEERNLLTRSFGADGAVLVVDRISDRGLVEIAALPFAKSPPPTGFHARPFFAPSTFAIRNGEISPDGHWLTYQSDESGPNEIYVRPYPNVRDGRSLVSTAGGTKPMWSRSGHELFYIDATGSLTSVPVQPKDGQLSFGKPTKLFDANLLGFSPNSRTYDVSPDGQKFLMVRNQNESESFDGSRRTIHVVVNWLSELQQPR